ncbi:MAG TPA: ABC transporter permease [Longimicrobiales bacterium]|nr:ABC transporter permease [Longimicrobiales bacterium]
MKRDLGPSPRRVALLRLYLGATWDVLRHAFGTGAGRTGGSGWVDSLGADARFALRQFGRRWATTLTMLAILSVGMSVSILLFSFVHSYATRPPRGVPASEEVVRIRGVQSSAVYGAVVRTFGEEEIEAYRALTGPFEEFTAWADATGTVDAVEGGTVTSKITMVTGDYFGAIGVRPALGGGLPAEPPGDATLDRVVVLGYGIWDRLFGRDPGVLGRTVRVNGAPLTVVGVAPPGFMGLNRLGGFQVWTPLANRAVLLPEDVASDLAFRAAARLRPGVTPEAATAVVAGVAERVTRAMDRPLAADMRDPTADVVVLRSANGDPNFDNDVRMQVISFGILGLLVLLVTCANVSALLMSLAAARRQELVIRISIGAPRRRIVRQLLTESALLATLAGGAALAIVWYGLRWTMLRFPSLPADIAVAPAAVAFTFGAALLVGLLFGLAPALHATGVTIGSALRDSSAAVAGGRPKLQRRLVVAQIALTQPLVVALVAVLLMVIGSFRTGQYEQTDRLIALDLNAAAVNPGANFDESWSARPLEEVLPGLVAAIEGLPGVVDVVPQAGSLGALGAYQVLPEDRAGGEVETLHLVGSTAAPGYFATTGIEVVRGRELRAGDVDAGALQERGAAVPVLIGSGLAERLWRGADPVGRRLQPVGDSMRYAAELVVAGVIADPDRMPADATPEVYVAADPRSANPDLFIRTAADADPLVPQIRRLVTGQASGWTAYVTTVAALEAESLAIYRGVTRALLGAGIMALLLSAVGLYAVMAFSVGQRAREIAVRRAVGAPAEKIAARFVGEGVRLGMVGLAIGLPVSLVALRVLNGIMLEGLSGYPGVGLPEVTAVVVLLVVVTAVAATLVPAGRAAAVDPAEVLRRG